MDTDNPTDILQWALGQGPLVVVLFFVLLRLEPRMAELRDEVRQLVDLHMGRVDGTRNRPEQPS